MEKCPIFFGNAIIISNNCNNNTYSHSQIGTDYELPYGMYISKPGFATFETISK